MRVVDTSLWIEYLADGRLADVAEKCIEPLSSCIVPAMVHFELVKWSNRKFELENAKSIKSLLTDCYAVPMEFGIATEAALLSIQHKLHATDAIIYATAQMTESILYTCDAHFKGLPGVEYFEK